ncbi:MAG: hypothetical protein ACM3OF_06795 [Gemmatimonas sp.]
MAEHEAHAITKMRAQDFHRRVRLTAVGALEISVLDKRDPGRRRTQDVIALTHWDCKHGRSPYHEDPVKVSYDLLLVTRNVKHFAATGVKLLGPFAG